MQERGETALLAWRMLKGLLVANQSRSLNPLQWSVVMWLPPNARQR